MCLSVCGGGIMMRAPSKLVHQKFTISYTHMCVLLAEKRENPKML